MATGLVYLRKIDPRVAIASVAQAEFADLNALRVVSSVCTTPSGDPDRMRLDFGCPAPLYSPRLPAEKRLEQADPDRASFPLTQPFPPCQFFDTTPPPPRPVGPPPTAWRSCKPMPWRVPPVGGSYRGGASKTPTPPPHPPHTTPPPTSPPPPPPLNLAALPPLFLRNPLSSFPVLGPARLPRRRAFTI